MEKLQVFNTISRKKEEFKAINPPFVGMYVCGPTVYGEPHLGHSRSAIAFDTVFRYLKYLGYKVRYVRNITDVGHLENDADEGEDKISKKARLEQLEPMEVAQYYTNRYHQFMDGLNVLRPSIEPCATGHIPEQIDMVQKIMENGYAYNSNGSVYFDVPSYAAKFKYGELSGRNFEEMLADTREGLEGGEEKRHPADFALWKKAAPEHLMRWDSPWSIGFPGWHLECTVMSTKYLGEQYDIHGGGMDLIFPHHEDEIAQSNAVIGDPHSHHLNEARFWLHNNMITIDGEKMSKSKGNFITLEEFFTGNHPRLDQAYEPDVIRFFMLQAHYRSPLDFSNTSLQGAEIALKKLGDAYLRLQELQATQCGEPVEGVKENLSTFRKDVESFMNDDFNTARVIARMFEVTPVINEMYQNRSKQLPIDAETLSQFRESFNTFFTEVLGLRPASGAAANSGITNGLMQLVIELRKQAREAKNWPMSDKIRDELAQLKVKLKDTPDGTEWYVED